MRRFVLLMALLSAVGFSFGWIQEDLCCVGGSYADDPTTPIVASEFALPAHLQATPRAALPAISIAANRVDPIMVGRVAFVPEAVPAAAPSLQNPRRC